MTSAGDQQASLKSGTEIQSLDGDSQFVELVGRTSHSDGWFGYDAAWNRVSWITTFHLSHEAHEAHEGQPI